jgi:hypothetical protein
MNRSLLSHPTTVAGRRLWIDGAMQDLIYKLHHGDPTIGWEGDERLAVYFDDNTKCWEVQRLEHDNVYRLVARSAPGVPFDDRFLILLCENDRQRRTQTLHDQIVANNERIDAQRKADTDAFIAEEAAPRLRHAILKEG